MRGNEVALSPGTAVYYYFKIIHRDHTLTIVKITREQGYGIITEVLMNPEARTPWGYRIYTGHEIPVLIGSHNVRMRE